MRLMEFRVSDALRRAGVTASVMAAMVFTAVAAEHQDRAEAAKPRLAEATHICRGGEMLLMRAYVHGEQSQRNQFLALAALSGVEGGILGLQGFRVRRIVAPPEVG